MQKERPPVPIINRYMKKGLDELIHAIESGNYHISHPNKSG